MSSWKESRRGTRTRWLVTYLPERRHQRAVCISAFFKQLPCIDTHSGFPSCASTIHITLTTSNQISELITDLTFIQPPGSFHKSDLYSEFSASFTNLIRPLHKTSFHMSQASDTNIWHLPTKVTANGRERGFVDVHESSSKCTVCMEHKWPQNTAKQLKRKDSGPDESLQDWGQQSNMCVSTRASTTWTQRDTQLMMILLIMLYCPDTGVLFLYILSECTPWVQHCHRWMKTATH